MLPIGSPAPNFSLPSQTGKVHSLSDQSGKWVIVYFYPKDDTPGCTKEACSFRDHASAFDGKNVTIFGVSKDDIESHDAFAKKYSLNFSLLADTDKKTLQAYEAWGEKMSMGQKTIGTLRLTYLIDPKGMIAKTYPNVKPEEHAEEILRDIESLA